MNKKRITSFEMNLNFLYLCRLVDSEQHIHGIVNKSTWMTFPHEWIVRKKYGLTVERLAINSVRVLFRFRALSQSSAHKVQMTSMSSCSVTPSFSRMWLRFWFEFPLWSTEGCSLSLNLHNFLIIFSSLKCKFDFISVVFYFLSQFNYLCFSLFYLLKFLYGFFILWVSRNLFGPKKYDHQI